MVDSKTDKLVKTFSSGNGYYDPLLNRVILRDLGIAKKSDLLLDFAKDKLTFYNN